MRDRYNQFKEKFCVACGHSGDFYPLDIDHIKTRGARKDLINDERNCITLCRKCHTEKHVIGVYTFVKKHKSVKNWMKKKGWEICPVAKKWFLN